MDPAEYTRLLKKQEENDRQQREMMKEMGIEMDEI